MRHKKLIAVIAAGLLIGAAPIADARHAAENHAREMRIERMEREAIEAKAEAERIERRNREREQRRAEAQRETAEAEARRAAEEVPDDEEDDYDNEVEEIDVVPERRPRLRERLDGGDYVPREHDAASNEMYAREARDENEDEAKAMDEMSGKESEGKEEEGILRRYLRRARENINEKVQSALPKETGKSLHVNAPVRMKKLDTDSMDVGGTLLFSDSPEYVSEPGILYRDEVNGNARVLYYHVNTSGKKAKVVVALENVSESYAVVHVTRRGTSNPSADYLAVGRATQRSYFDDEQGRGSMYIAPGDKRLLLPEMEKTIVNPDELIYGVVDFSSTAPVRVTVMMCMASANPLEAMSELPVLPKDEHRLRGTFIGMDRIVRVEKYDPGDGFAFIRLADDSDDKFKDGIDATDGSLTKNRGNYGVLYRIEARSSRDKLHAFLCPLGGVYTGAMRVEERAGESVMVMTPSGLPFFGDAGGEASAEKDKRHTVLYPAAELTDMGLLRGSRELAFEFSPPGASNLPVLLILAPEHWEKERMNDEEEED
ncbi:MAG: copper amine oxidase [Schwartzia sp.]|nr:copper amine oxidase [Schwartzia sp. (in: firmicutes)]